MLKELFFGMLATKDNTISATEIEAKRLPLKSYLVGLESAITDDNNKEKK